MNNTLQKKVSAALLLLAALLLSSMGNAAGVVIVHPSNTSTLSENDITRIFLGRKSVYPSGSPAIAIDQKGNATVRTEFINNVLNKSEQQFKAYWAQQLFTGKGKPPKQVGDSVDVKQLVSKNPALIGFIDKDKVDNSVRVLLSF